MKMIKKAITLSVGLVMMGSAAFAQNIADAKRAIDAEQYQKATSILKGLTASQPKKGENFFYLGNVYLKINEIDSANAAFTSGAAAEPKFALNYVGLGNVELFNNNAAAAKSHFDNAANLGRKDYRTFLYIGKAYTSVPEPNFAEALPYLTKADELDVKDADEEVFIALGDYYALQKQNSQALQPYLRATMINDNNLRPTVQIGRMYTRAYNFADAENRLKQALEKDPNYGPAYRELAETQMEWSRSEPKRSKELQKSALDNYRKYLDLTDKSFESRLRYAQFLVYVNDFETLEEVAAGLAQDNESPNRELLIARLRGYSSYEVGKYPQALTFMQDVFEKGKSQPERIQPSDYAYLGKALSQGGQDSLAFLNVKKAVALDTTLSEDLVEIGKKFAADRKYLLAGEAFEIAAKSNATSPTTLTNYYYAGTYKTTHYRIQAQAKAEPSKTLLEEADKSFELLNKTTPEFEIAYLSRATIAKLMEEDPNAPVGLARPYYEQYIEQVTVKQPEKASASTKGLVEAYGYLAYLLMDKEPAKAIELFNKVLALEPDNQYASDNIKYLNSVAAQNRSK